MAGRVPTCNKGLLSLGPPQLTAHDVKLLGSVGRYAFVARLRMAWGPEAGSSFPRPCTPRRHKKEPTTTLLVKPSAVRLVAKQRRNKRAIRHCVGVAGRSRVAGTVRAPYPDARLFERHRACRGLDGLDPEPRLAQASPGPGSDWHGSNGTRPAPPCAA